jgi:hypothetical protein
MEKRKYIAMIASGEAILREYENKKEITKAFFRQLNGWELADKDVNKAIKGLTIKKVNK